MASIKDERGFSQGFKPSKALSKRTERRCDYIISKLPPGKHIKILELGSGTGEMAYNIAKETGAQVVAADISKVFIDEARNKFKLDNLRYIVLDLSDRKRFLELLSEEKFDCIIGNGILHHLFEKLPELLGDVHGGLNNSGRIVFLEPNILNPYCYLIFNLSFLRMMAGLEPGEKAFSKKIINKVLSNIGFENISIEHKDFLLPITPEPMIDAAIRLGEIAERIPLLNKWSQSIFISAAKKDRKDVP